VRPPALSTAPSATAESDNSLRWCLPVKPRKEDHKVLAPGSCRWHHGAYKSAHARSKGSTDGIQSSHRHMETPILGD
jgi:hypothetical protein